MSHTLRLAITADLHWGIRPLGDAATQLLVAFLEEQPPDLLILAGDIGADADFEPCLALFDPLTCRKALVPGNHDIWVRSDDVRGDSLHLYNTLLPEISTRHGFHYLDQGPLLVPEAGLGLVGSMNWYDYSWSLEALQRHFPGDMDRLRTKHFLRGRHNDARFVRWPLDDVTFTAKASATLSQHLETVLSQGHQAIVITHHPPFYGLNFPRLLPAVTLDALLWDAFSGNRTVETLLHKHGDHIPFAFCGHTHRARDNTFGPIRGYNIGGDYEFKRLLLLDWPQGTVEAHTFGTAPSTHREEEKDPGKNPP